MKVVKNPLEECICRGLQHNLQFHDRPLADKDSKFQAI